MDPVAKPVRWLGKPSPFSKTEATASIESDVPSPRVLNPDLSARIAITRFVMVMGIVILHVPPHQSLSELGLLPMEMVKAFFSGALFRTSVLVLTMLSGFLLFSRRQLPYFELIKKKAASLLVPLILWNAPVVAAIYIAQSQGLMTHDFSTELHPPRIENWLNGLLSITSAPANFPLYFLRDLFVLALLSPLLALCFRWAPVLGFLAVLVVATLSLDGALLLRNDMLIAFYIGGVAAWHSWDVTALDRYAYPLMAALVMYCLIVIALDLDTGPLVRVTVAVLVWPVMGLLSRASVAPPLRRHSDASFLIFLSHAPLLAILWLIYQRLLSALPYALFWLAAPVICAAIGIAANAALRRFAPTLRTVLLGAR